MPRLGRSLLVLVTGVVIAAPTGGMPAEAAPAVARVTCRGHVATIVGDPDVHTLEGTPGDDVIVSNGSMEVTAGDGDDVICMTGRAAYEDGYQEAYVEGGRGDDVVTTALDDVAVLYAQLGEGADHFTGGPESDLVAGDTLAFDVADPATDSDPDVIDTGASGFDLVQVGDGGPLADQVRVRSGAAHVEAHASGLAGDGSLAGGPRSSRTVIDTSGPARGGWGLDLVAGTASLGGAPTFTWTGFHHLVWAVPGTIDVIGTEGADVVTGPVTSGDLGAGDDKVYVWSSKADHDSHRGRLDGGPGTDQVRFFAGSVSDDAGGPGGGVVPFTPADVTVDVARRRTTFAGGEVVAIAGFEWFGAQTDRTATLLGGPGDDRLSGSACDLRIRGGAGDDRLSQQPKIGSAGFTNPSCRGRRGGVVASLSGGAGDDVLSVEARTSTLRGGRGDDALLGGSGRDHLLGGPGDDRLLGDDGADVLVGGDGQDTALGGRGDDACRAEYGSTCERPTSATHLEPHPPGARPHSVRLKDATRDVRHADDPDHSQTTPAPDVAVGDVVAVRTTYRDGRVEVRTRLRSLRTSDEARIYLDLQYHDAIQFQYGSAQVDVAQHGASRVTARGHEGECDADVRVDRARASLEVSFDASCLGDPRSVRVAVTALTADDLTDPTYLNRDRAPEQRGRVERFGPTAWDH
ncbi:hypothetical protein BH11ACT8_BH11ACT8_29000 [soil metagenome]